MECPPPSGDGSVTGCQLCASPEAYDGQRMTLVGPFAAPMFGTGVGCCCCNSMLGYLVVPCDGARVVLRPAPGLELPTTQALRVPPYPADPLSLHATGRSIVFGCMGQDCFEQCNPAPPERLVSVTGTYRRERVDLDGLDTSISFDAWFEVESFVVDDGSTVWTADDCARIGDAQDLDRCAGDFTCDVGGGRLAHCVAGRIRVAECALEARPDAGVPVHGAVP